MREMKSRTSCVGFAGGGKHLGISFYCSALFSGTAAGNEPSASTGPPHILSLLTMCDSTGSLRVSLLLYTLHPIQPGTTFSTGTLLLRLVGTGLKEGGSEGPPPSLQHTGKYIGQNKIVARFHHLHHMSFCTSSPEEENKGWAQPPSLCVQGPGAGQPAKPCGLREDPWGPRAVRCPPLSVNSEDHLFTSWCFLQPSVKLC